MTGPATPTGPAATTGLPATAAASLMRAVTGARWFAGKGRRPELRSFTPLPWLNDPAPATGDAEEVPRVRLAVLELGYPDEALGAADDRAGEDAPPGVEYYQLALAHRSARVAPGVSAAAAELYVDDDAVVYDATLAASVETPTEAMLGVGAPVTILRGEPTYPFLVAAAERLAAAMPSAELVVVPESHDHGVDPAATARLERSRIA